MATNKWPVKDTVIWCLRKYPAFRDNKRELIAYILKMEFAKLYPDVTATQKYDQFIEALTEGILSHPETIAREWRKVQEEFDGENGRENLRGLKFTERHTNQQERVKPIYR